jgi:hypothetical protein
MASTKVAATVQLSTQIPRFGYANVSSVREINHASHDPERLHVDGRFCGQRAYIFTQQHGAGANSPLF